MDIEERKKEIINRKVMRRVTEGAAQLFDFAGIIRDRKKEEIRQRIRNQSDFKKVL